MNELFSLKNKAAIVTGGTGVLGGAIAHGLAAAGATVGILGRRDKRAQQVADEITAAGGSAIVLAADVLDRESLATARDKMIESTGSIDVLVNAAGGNMPEATIHGDVTFFNMTKEAFDQVMELNLAGTLLPCQVFGEVMAEQKSGAIVNISSMASKKPLTRVLGYGNAKAAIDNYTMWLATEFAHKFGEGLRVNAIAPGFFIGDQNRAFLLNEDGSLTARGEQIISNTPMGRFGVPDELVGTTLWLASDASKFVTGVVVPVDGGFSAFGGL